MDHVVVTLLVPHCCVDILVSLFLTSKGAKAVLSSEEIIVSLYQRSYRLLSKDRAFLLKTIWDNKHKQLTPESLFPSLVSLVDKYYITQRTRKHIPDVNKYVQRCTEFNRPDLVSRVTGKDLRTLYTGIDHLICIFVDQEDYDSLWSLSHNFSRYVDNILNSSSLQGKFNLFKRVYEQSMNPLLDRTVALRYLESHTKNFIAGHNVDGVRYMLSFGEASLTALIIEGSIRCGFTQLTEEIGLAVAPEDYRSRVLWNCRDREYYCAIEYLNGDREGR